MNKELDDLKYIANDIPKHKKKSNAKGLPRSKHKHVYETVLLTKYYHYTDFKTGQPITTQHTLPTKVCAICGRIKCIDKNPKYYIKKHVCDLPIRVYEDELSKVALKLPKWYADDYFDKIAHQ